VHATIQPIICCLKQYKLEIILSVVLYGRETWSATLSEEHRLTVFENRVLRRIFGPKRDGVMGEGENCITRSWVICTLLQIYLE
jgi:hypothetical protein